MLRKRSLLSDKAILIPQEKIENNFSLCVPNQRKHTKQILKTRNKK